MTSLNLNYFLNSPVLNSATLGVGALGFNTGIEGEDTTQSIALTFTTLQLLLLPFLDLVSDP